MSICFPDISKLALHLPTHSGIRIDATFNKELLPIPGHYSCPLGVIEFEGKFISVFDPEGKAHMEVYSCDGGWEWSWQSEQHLKLVWGQTENLEDSINLYREVRPMDTINRDALSKIKRILTLDMMLSNGEVVHCYDDVIDLIVELASNHLASGTLIYIPGWCGKYDKDYPNYLPSEQLGGEQGFSRMMEKANRENVIVMPHMNYWGYDPELQLFTKDQLKDMQLHDEHGVPAGWAGPTSPFLYMRPDHPEWQKVLLKQITSFLAKYDIKAIMLDQIGFEIRDKRCDFKKGTDEILNQIRLCKPELIISGEMLNDHLVSEVNLIQTWGMPWCGLGIDLTAYTSSITKALFPEVSFYGHLGLPAISEGKYTWTNHEYLSQKGIEAAFYEAQQHLSAMGGIPHVRLHYKTNGLDSISLRYLLSRDNEVEKERL
ncbi:DUF6259 domain-containing protein [Paenibacillus nasutitermitis]|nr:DUF6259 domain-containing protein [Paenibacillus nasutitermitis]